MSDTDWERSGQRPAFLRRAAVMVAMLGAIAGAAFLVRVGPEEPVPGTLAVDANPSPSETPAQPTPSRTPRPTRTETPAPSPTPTPPTAQGSWRPLPELPLEDRWTRPIWVDDAWFIWGGEHQRDRRVFHDDGATLEPGARAWREVPAAPIDPRGGHVTVWTGSQVVVWGGETDWGYLNDGAAYDPATGRWVRIADAPLAPRSGAAGVWTGEEVVVLGGYDNAGARLEVAAYDPVQGSWRALPPLPADDIASAWSFGALWTGRSVVAWWSGRGTKADHNLHALDPDSGQWEPLPALAIPSGGAHLTVARAGGRLVAVQETYDSRPPSILVLDAENESWTELDVESAAVQDWDSWGLVTSMDERVFLLSRNEGLVADVAGERVELVPEPSQPFPEPWMSMLLTGNDRVLLWGVTFDASGLTEDLVAQEWVPDPE